jgi:hypothetical protein
MMMLKAAGALIISVLVSTAALAAPAQLTDRQMDSVTAGLSVAAKSIAVAVGRYTDTDTRTKVVATEGERYSIGWGFTKGFAKAHGRTDEGRGPRASSRSYASGDGDIVKKYRSGRRWRSRDGEIALSWAMVIAVDINVDVSSLSRYQKMMLHRDIYRDISNLASQARRGKLL